MKNILLITTVYRTGEKIYPIIPRLSDIYNVDILHMYQMSNQTIFPEEEITRKLFDKKYLSYIRNEYNGPRYFKNPDKDGDSSVNFVREFEDVVKENNYSLVIWDNNTTIKGGGMSLFYKLFSRCDIKVLGSPHGNKEYKACRLHKRMGRIYDFSFVFGEKEKKKFIKIGGEKFSKNFLPAGIPCNDDLINYDRGNKYILVIPNYTTKDKCLFKPFTKKLFDEMKFLELRDRYNCKILIKEKQSVFYRSSYSIGDSFKKEGVEVVGFCENDNKLIADAKVVIGAPSTLSLKSIQMGIPTIVFKGYGAIGNFDDFPGLISPSYDNIRDSVKYQLSQGKLNKYVECTIAGGIDFRSIDLYIEYINKILSDII